MAFNREKTLASAQKHLRKGNVDKAIREYEKLIEEDPTDVRSKLKFADLLVKADRFDEALMAYQQVAYSYAADDLYEKAAAVYKQAMRISPEDPILHTHLGEAYYRLGRLKDAVRVFHRAQKIYKKDGDVAAQRDVLERMVRIDPDDIGLRIQLAERYEKDDMREESLDLFRSAAAQLKEEGRLDEFVQVAERIIFLEPRLIEMRKEVVRIYLGRGDEKHALKHLQYCFKVTPQDIETLELLGSTFHRLGSNEKALLVYSELAALYERMGEQDRAASAYRTILSIDHTHDQARRFLGETQPKPARQTRPEIEAEPVDEEDALDGIEFLDDDDDDSGELFVSDNGADRVGGDFMDFAEDAIRDFDPDLNQMESYPEAPMGQENTAAVEISESSLEIVEIEPAETEEGDEDGGDQLHQFLTESEVFLKYGLLDRAEDVITKVLQIDPSHLGGRQQMKKLLERQGDKRGAAHQLVEMARISSDNPNLARGYLKQAQGLVSDDVLETLCQGAGVALDLDGEVEVAPSFIDEVSEGLEEISSMAGTEEEEPAGMHTIDIDDGVYELDEALFLDADESEAVELSGPSAVSDDSPPDLEAAPSDMTMEDFDIEVVEEVTEAGAPDEDVHVIEEFDEELEIVEEFDIDEVDEIEDFDEDTGMGLEVETDAEIDLDGAMDIDVVDDIDLGMLDDVDLEIDDDIDMEIGDDLSLDDADVVDINVDDMNFDQDELAALDASAAGDGGEEFDLDISAEDADAMFDELFGGGMFGDDDGDDELGFGAAELGDDSSADELDQANGSGGANHFGSRSLSQKFKGPVTDTEGVGSINNSSLELGKTYKDMGLYAEAIDEFRHAMEDPDAAPAALYNIALCYIELGETEDAAENLTQLSQDESAPNGWRMMAHEKLEELHP